MYLTTLACTVLLMLRRLFLRFAKIGREPGIDAFGKRFVFQPAFGSVRKELGQYFYQLRFLPFRCRSMDRAFEFDDQMGKLNLLETREPSGIRAPVVADVSLQLRRQVMHQLGLPLQMSGDALDGQ